MYVRLNVFACPYVYIYIYICRYVLSVDGSVCLSGCLYACTNACRDICPRVCLYVCMHTYVYLYLHTCHTWARNVRFHSCCSPGMTKGLLSIISNQPHCLQHYHVWVPIPDVVQSGYQQTQLPLARGLRLLRNRSFNRQSLSPRTVIVIPFCFMATLWQHSVDASRSSTVMSHTLVEPGHIQTSWCVACVLQQLGHFRQVAGGWGEGGGGQGG